MASLGDLPLDVTVDIARRAGGLAVTGLVCRCARDATLHAAVAVYIAEDVDPTLDAFAALGKRTNLTSVHLRGCEDVAKWCLLGRATDHRLRSFRACSQATITDATLFCVQSAFPLLTDLHLQATSDYVTDLSLLPATLTQLVMGMPRMRPSRTLPTLACLEHLRALEFNLMYMTQDLPDLDVSSWTRITALRSLVLDGKCRVQHLQRLTQHLTQLTHLGLPAVCGTVLPADLCAAMPALRSLRFFSDPTDWSSRHVLQQEQLPFLQAVSRISELECEGLSLFMAHVFPHVRVLRLVDDVRKPADQLKLCETLNALAPLASLTTLEHISQPGVSQLRLVWDPPDCVMPHLSRIMVLLGQAPSLVPFDLVHLHCSDYPLAIGVLSLAQRLIRVLKLSHCDIDTAVLGAIREHLPGLKTLICESCDVSSVPASHWRLAWMPDVQFVRCSVFCFECRREGHTWGRGYPVDAGAVDV